MIHRHVLHTMFVGAALVAAPAAWAQQPFDLDPVFRSNIDSWYVSSIAPLPDGRVFLSGQIKFPGELDFRGGAMLLPNGSRDMTFTGVIESATNC